MGEIEELQTAFPDIEIKELQGGANLYFPNKVITVYFRRKKYAVNNVWSKYAYWQDFIPLVNTLVNPPKKVAPIEPQAPKKSIEELMKELDAQPWQIVDSSGVQKCIDHISRKRDFILANQPDNKLATFCLTLMDELRQYL